MLTLSILYNDVTPQSSLLSYTMHAEMGGVIYYVTISDKTNLLAVKSILRYRFAIHVTLVDLCVQACNFHA